jgi:L-fuculose-phosphate aldolase
LNRIFKGPRTSVRGDPVDNDQIENFKKNIITIGRLLWEKDLVSGLNGNISRRVDDETILLTAHGACLGLLQEKDVLLMKLDGELLEEGGISTEKLLHTEIYKNFPETTAVIHTHTTYTNAYFLENTTLAPQIFESKMCLGKVKSVEQLTPAVTDAGPVVEALKGNDITVLRNHGVVAKGGDLFDCFLLIQALEEAATINAIARLYKNDMPSVGEGFPGLSIAKARTGKPSPTDGRPSRKYKLFSQEQIDDIVKIVNEDEQMKELGAKTKMTMDLAVQLDDTGATYSFSFENGRIARVGNDAKAEFLISAPENIWRAVFNREIDPFVATTQKKMRLKGDFAKISKWYAPCSRIFELWQRVPVE